MRVRRTSGIAWFRWGAMFTFVTGCWLIVITHMVTGTAGMAFE